MKCEYHLVFETWVHKSETHGRMSNGPPLEGVISPAAEQSLAKGNAGNEDVMQDQYALALAQTI